MFIWALPFHAFHYELKDGSDIAIFAFDNNDSTCDFGDSKKRVICKNVSCDFSNQEQVESYIARYLMERDIQIKQPIGEFFHISCILNRASSLFGGVSVFEKCVESDARLRVSHRLLCEYGKEIIQLEVSSDYIEGLSIWDYRQLKLNAALFWRSYHQ